MTLIDSLFRSKRVDKIGKGEDLGEVVRGYLGGGVKLGTAYVGALVMGTELGASKGEVT